MKISTILFVLLTVGLASPAMAACELSQFNVSAVVANYDPFAESFTPASTRLQVQTNSSNDCKGARVQLALTYSPTSPQSGSQVDLKFGGADLFGQVTGSSGQIHPVSDPATAFSRDPNSSPLSRGGLLGSGGTFQFSVTPGQPVPPGRYYAELQLLARVTDAAGKTSNFSAQFPIVVVVAPSVRLAAGSGTFIIDIGELTPGATGGPVRFDAYANIDYDIRLHSDNGFALARNGRSASLDHVPYIPIVSGTAADAAGAGGERIRTLFFSGPGGGLRHHTLAVRILPFSGVRSGDYLDLLTMEIRARI
jgi:hypothetical protein